MAKLGDEETGSYVPRSKSTNLTVKFQTFKMKKSASKETVNRSTEFNWSVDSCNGFLFTIYIVIYITYIALGGLIFMRIEGKHEVNMYEKLQMAKGNVIRMFPGVSGEALDAFMSEISSAGVSGLDVVNATEPKWSYSQSVFFCVTLLTTIGYGHVAPVSVGGKAVCMLYTAFGVPGTLVILAGCAERLMSPARGMVKVLTVCLRGIFKPVTIRLFFLGFVALIVGVLFFILPAFIFSKLEEEWTFMDGLYYCFISLTTVGLGDFVPGKNTNIQHREVYRFLVILYLMTGILAVMFLMALFTEFRESRVRKVVKIMREPVIIKPPSYGSVMEEKERLLLKESQFEISYDRLQP